MPDTTVVSPSIIASPKSGADGPKYDEDVNLLEEGNTDDSTGVVEVDESDLDEGKEVKVTLPKKDQSDEDSDEDESEEPEEDEDESTKPADIPFDRPTITEIKAEFPELFKKFPALKDSYFRELEFSKLFPTIEDAKEAFEDNEAFSTLSESALSGDPVPLLDSIEKTDTKAFELFANSFLPALYKKNQDLYVQTVNPIFQNLVRSLFADRDENTRNAGLVLADFLFGANGESIAKGQTSVVKSTELSAEQKKLKEQRDNQLTTGFRASAGKVQENVTKSLEALALKNVNFDPNKVFSPFLRKQGAQEVIKRVMKQLESDKGHMTVMAARWKRARANGYTSDDESKIISTYLARAKSLIPDACSKVSAAMLGTKVKAADDRREQTRSAPREINSGRTSEGRSSSSSSGRFDYSKMSDADIFAS